MKPNAFTHKAKKPLLRSSKRRIYTYIITKSLRISNNAHNHNALNSYEKARKNYVCRIGIVFDGIVKMWTFEKKVRIYSRKKPPKICYAEFRIPNKLKLRNCEQICIWCARCIVKTSGGFEI